jgi:HrpA-like RNA helicase
MEYVDELSVNEIPSQVHERDIDADLVNLVVKLQMQNTGFRLIVMSATLQGDLFGR